MAYQLLSFLHELGDYRQVYARNAESG